MNLLNYYIGDAKCKNEIAGAGHGNHDHKCDTYTDEASCPTSGCVWTNNKCNKSFINIL